MFALQLVQFILNGHNNNPHHVEFEELEKLVEQQQNDRVKSIVTDVSNVSNVVDACGTTILHLAAKHNNHELINIFIDLGFDVNAKNSFGATPLSTALLSNHVKTVEVLLNNDADLDAADDLEHVLQTVVVNKETLPEFIVVNLMQKLKKCIEDLESMSVLLLKVNCPLKLVIFMNDASLTQAMLDVPDYPIDNYDEIVAVLKHIMNVADIENLRILWQSDRTDLHRNHLLNQISQWLHKSALDWESVKLVFKQLDRWIVYDAGFEYFLSTVFQWSSRRVIEILLRDCDVDVQMKQIHQFDVLPMLFFASPMKANENVHELALEREFEVNARSYCGQTALYYAVLAQSPELVRLLLDMGADSSMENVFEITAWNRVPSGDCCAVLLQHCERERISEKYERQVIDSLKLFDRDVTWSIFIAQLAVERRQGFAIKEAIVETIDGNSRVKDMYESCLKQVEELGYIEVLAGLTWFDVLVSTAEKLAMYVRSREAVSIVDEWFSKGIDVHPFYRSTLKVKTERAFNFFRAKSRVARIVFDRTSVLIGFDHLIVDKLFGFLCYKDVMGMVEFV